MAKNENVTIYKYILSFTKLHGSKWPPLCSFARVTTTSLIGWSLFRIIGLDVVFYLFMFVFCFVFLKNDVQIALMWLLERCMPLINNLGAHGRSFWKGLCVIKKINFSVKKMNGIFTSGLLLPFTPIYTSLNNIIIPLSSPKQL